MYIILSLIHYFIHRGLELLCSTVNSDAIILEVISARCIYKATLCKAYIPYQYQSCVSGKSMLASMYTLMLTKCQLNITCLSTFLLKLRRNFGVAATLYYAIIIQIKTKQWRYPYSGLSYVAYLFKVAL